MADNVPADGILVPKDEAELAEIVAGAAGARRPLAVSGGNTRSGLGRPVQAAAGLSTRGLTGITLYEPAELVMSARAGTPLREVEAALAERGQRLAFEPIDHRALYGTAGEPTIGGVAAVNASGPRRIEVGAARDALIGIRGVNGRGELIRSGGRVMKNVTGYDLVKALAGSHGTLAVLSEVTFKVLPAPETETTLVLTGLDDATAIAALSAALGSPWEASGAAHLPGNGASGEAQTLIRIENFAPSVDYRAGRLTELLSELPGVREIAPLPAGESQVLWRQVRDLASIVSGGAADAVWRLSVRPSHGPAVVGDIRRVADCRVFYDWGGGLIWLAMPSDGDAGAAAIRAAVAAHGGHATLMRAPAALRNAVDVFQPPAPALLALSRSLKQTFDPAGILNPGKMYAGV